MEAAQVDERLLTRVEIEDGTDFVVREARGDDLEASPVTIEDQEVAGWTLKRLAHLKARVAELQAQRDRERAFLDARFETMAGRLKREISWRAGGLEMFLRAMHRKDPRVRKIETLFGSLRLTKGRATREVPDDGSLEMWLQENAPSFLKTEVNRAALLKATKLVPPTIAPDGTVTEPGCVIMKETGEVVEPITVKAPGEPSFSYSLPGALERVEEGGDEE